MAQAALQTTPAATPAPIPTTCARCGCPIASPTYTDLVGGWYCDADCLELAETREPVDLDKRIRAAWHDDEYLSQALADLFGNIVTADRREVCQGVLWPHELEQDDEARQACAALRSLPDSHPLTQIARRKVREFVEAA